MIIKSILDTDLYKFTTSYAYMKLFPQARGTFEFIDRDNTEYPEDFIERLYLELGSLGMLHLTKDENYAAEYLITAVIWLTLLRGYHLKLSFLMLPGLNSLSLVLEDDLVIMCKT